MTTHSHPSPTLAELGPDSPAEDLRAVYERGGATVAELIGATGTSRAKVENKLRRAGTRMRPSGRRPLHPAPGRPTPIATARTCAVSAPSPIVIRYVLARRLRELRVQAGLTQTQAARRAEVGYSSLSRVENPQAPPIGVRLLRALCQLYDASPSVCEELFGLWQDSGLPPWWEQQNLHVPDANERIVFGVRADAVRVHGWAEALVPELLRTADYENALAGAMGAEKAQMAVAVCVAAQRRVRQRGVEQRYVVDEALIRRPVGGPQVMAEQVAALRGLAEQGRLRVLAWDSGRCPPESAFELCTVPGLDTVLYHLRARTIRMGEPFDHPREVFIRLWGQAAHESATLALLNDAYTRLSTPAPSPQAGK